MIASARVHVERVMQSVMQRIKVFKVFSDVIDWDLLPYINDIILIVLGLINYTAPILSDQRFL